MLADVVIIMALLGAVLVGVFRGALRQFIVLGALLVTFIVAAQVRPPIAGWLIAQEPDFSAQYAEMISFVLAFVVLFGVALVIIETGGRTIVLSGRPLVDEVQGGFLMLGAGLLWVTALLAALGTYYAVTPEGVTAELELLRELNAALETSAIATALRDSLVPALQTLLGPLLPADVRAAG